jgi:hypothetical protein
MEAASNPDLFWGGTVVVTNHAVKRYIERCPQRVQELYGEQPNFGAVRLGLIWAIQHSRPATNKERHKFCKTKIGYQNSLAKNNGLIRANDYLGCLGVLAVVNGPQGRELVLKTVLGLHKTTKHRKAG